MTTPRRRSSGSAPSSSGRRRASAPPAKGSNLGVIIGVAVAIVVVVVIAMNMGGDKKAEASSGSPSKKTPVSEQKASGSSGGTSRSVTDEADKPGKTPDRPAPAIPASVWSETAALYQTAKDEWNVAQKARKDGETENYKGGLKRAWKAMESLNATIEPYTNWFEEADMGDWAMPGDYVKLQKRFFGWDKHAAKIQKIMAR